METIGDRTRTHGLSKHPLYFIRNRIKSACKNPNYADYKNYGGRGIKICSEWDNDFLSFYNWAMENGYKQGLTIERIDVNGDYCPENCKFITNEEQANNRTTSHYLEYHGVIMTIKDWSMFLELNYKLFHKHLTKCQFDLEKAIKKYHIEKLEKLREV